MRSDAFTDLSPTDNLWRIMKNKIKKARNKTVEESKKDLLKMRDRATFVTLKSF